MKRDPAELLKKINSLLTELQTLSPFIDTKDDQKELVYFIKNFTSVVKESPQFLRAPQCGELKSCQQFLIDLANEISDIELINKIINLKKFIDQLLKLNSELLPLPPPLPPRRQINNDFITVQSQLITSFNKIISGEGEYTDEEIKIIRQIKIIVGSIREKITAPQKQMLNNLKEGFSRHTELVTDIDLFIDAAGVPELTTVVTNFLKSAKMPEVKISKKNISEEDVTNVLKLYTIAFSQAVHQLMLMRTKKNSTELKITIEPLKKCAAHLSHIINKKQYLLNNLAEQLTAGFIPIDIQNSLLKCSSFDFTIDYNYEFSKKLKLAILLSSKLLEKIALCNENPTDKLLEDCIYLDKIITIFENKGYEKLSDTEIDEIEEYLKHLKSPQLDWQLRLYFSKSPLSLSTSWVSTELLELPTQDQSVDSDQSSDDDNLLAEVDQNFF